MKARYFCSYTGCDHKFEVEIVTKQMEPEGLGLQITRDELDRLAARFQKHALAVHPGWEGSLES